MWRTPTLVVSAVTLLSGCLLDPYVGHRPARFHAGPTSRAVTLPTAPDPTAGPIGAARSVAPSPSDDPNQVSASSVALQFTVLTAHPFYTGIEAETGRLALPGSNLAIASAVIGIDQPLGPLSFGAELAAGWQSLRYNRGDDEHGSLVAEPRVRGHLWIADQWTLGASFGARLSTGLSDDWMAGAYLGVHSRRF